MRIPKITFTLMGALALASCGTTSAAQFPTQLPSTVVVDDKIGSAVELAYQAAALAERTAVRAGFVNAEQAAHLAALDNQAYTYVCYTRTAYDLANGQSPAARADTCPAATKTGTGPAYADAARSAITILREIISSLTAYRVASLDMDTLEGAAVTVEGPDYVAPRALATDSIA